MSSANVKAGVRAALKEAHDECEGLVTVAGCLLKIRTLSLSDRIAAIAATVPLEPDERDAEIERLRARVAELEERLEIKWAWDGNGNRVPAPPNMPDGIEARNETIKLMDRNIEALRARVAELEKDAARYRHMKSNATFQNRNGPRLYWYLPRYNRELPIGERLDAAIDAAMKEGKE